jgi:hypothetical protein
VHSGSYVSLISFLILREFRMLIQRDLPHFIQETSDTRLEKHACPKCNTSFRKRTGTCYHSVLQLLLSSLPIFTIAPSASSACCWLDQVGVPPHYKPCIRFSFPHVNRIIDFVKERGWRSGCECCFERLLLSYILTIGVLQAPLPSHKRECKAATLHARQTAVVTASSAPVTL